jgi:alginate O-acetyltransferase complex protein AlgI
MGIGIFAELISPKMLFSTIDFALYLPVVFVIYWLLAKNLKLQNLFVVFASYIFYGWWDPRFLVLIFLSTLLDYQVGKGIKAAETKSKKKRLLGISLAFNLGALLFFKYFNFFVDNFTAAFSFFGYAIEGTSLNIILPVGISFYTFQTLSYSIDIYRGKLEPSDNFIAFAAFVSYFPQLVAGPIERASNLLPQMNNKRHFSFSKAQDGVSLIIWGLFKKVVIADNIAPTVDSIFGDIDGVGSSTLIIGAVLFAFQIYCDFSGYTDIARGLSKLLGIELMKNFDFPYFSRNIGEFWRRWHISLSTWFRDYLYIPLGGSRVRKDKAIRNVFIIFLVSGFWHGANWTFIIWGGLHALYFIPSFVTNRNRRHTENIEFNRFGLPSMRDTMSILYTFIITTIAWVFFRASSAQEAIHYLANIVIWEPSSRAIVNPYDHQVLTKEYFYLIMLIVLEYLMIRGYVQWYKEKKAVRLLVDVTFFLLVMVNTPVSKSLSFIYFQF